MALDKLPLLFALSVSYYIAITPPNPPASHEEISKYPLGERTPAPVASLVAALKTLLLTFIFCEIIVIVSTHYATTGSVFAEMTMTSLVRTSSHDSFHTPSPATTPIFLAGFFLTLCGACVRWASYRALDPLFTFELSIRDQHKLITTGPYYDGIFHQKKRPDERVSYFIYMGSLTYIPSILLCVLGPGSWIYECGWLDLVSVKIFAVLVTAAQAIFVLFIPSRMDNEDRMMQKEFGQQWDEWAKKVPYKLVPGIF
ncbi:hypothetical protein BT96DRAFT_1063402 [Gymnopus androsaceus JB14]|uniref:Protein-S-isoprenylcysteine O-methyltransferase n=1 Tax=Gymnopus androsaceus JB14 TaxID=1447944 RepID=A0A6A4H0K3_9AGAR|nr:hypothetical protein BT96DRAFT_1063402 [Gymnopus androsaceus JB14]